MFYLENYGIYKDLIENKHITINAKDINKTTWNMHFNSLLNILKDGIDTDYVRYPLITIHFEEIDVELAIPDLWLNVMLWYMPIAMGENIKPCDLVFEENGTTGGTIKRFMDKFIDKYRSFIDTILLNNMIDDCMYNFRNIDTFSLYLANTVSLDDFVDLMDKNPEFYDLMHVDLSHLPLDQVKMEGTKLSNRSIEIIKKSDHCMANYFLAGEGINPKQYKELCINIGPKPNGQGGVFPTIVNQSYINGGVKSPLNYAIESSTGRLAQIIVEGNVGTAGDFARLLGLNCMDTVLNEDPNYVCNTKHFEEITITNKTFDLYLNRYFRYNPKGLEYKITKDIKKDVIGKKIYLRSPMTCASAAAGKGICYRCYGDLAHNNKYINIGRLASEVLSAVFTQMMLSAKHLLEAKIRELKWNEGFFDYFDVEYNIITLKDDFDYSGFKIRIDLEDISLEHDEDENIDTGYNEYITNFDLILPNDTVMPCNTLNVDNLYITDALNSIIKEYTEKNNTLKGVYCDDDCITIDVPLIQDVDNVLFALNVVNNDLSSNLKQVKDIINKAEITKSMDKNQILERFNDVLLSSKINLQSIHSELVLMNQIVSKDDILEKPDWTRKDAQYEILTLMQALDNNPSITKRLSYAKIARAFKTPITYRSYKPSFMDVFFMINPQNYINSEVAKNKEKINENGMKIFWNKSKNKKKED